jgi:hypothetical protein
MSRYLLLLLPLVACGGPDFAGTYNGTMTIQVTCPSGVNSVSEPLTLALTESGNAVTDNDPSCPGLSGTSNGNVVTLSPVACPQSTDSSGNKLNFGFSGGTWTLDGKTISANMSGTLSKRASDNTETSCTALWSGTLTKP